MNVTNLTLLWLVPLWLQGWLILPAARRLFVNLPDGGLAAGRVLGITIPCLLAFWGAVWHVIPLTAAPFWLGGLPLLVGILSLRTGEQRRLFIQWMKEHRFQLFTSDAVFLATFLFYLWVRMRWPDINNLEKGMDSGLMASLQLTDYLPADSFWFSGRPFTNYYYFGHLMGALLARSFDTPMVYAFNLVQPLFCALFVAPLWSLCAALTNSCRRGAVAVAIVALCGHFEPLRQVYELATAGVTVQWLNPMWWITNLDWWKTSRVIPDSIINGKPTFTINEYPAFTLVIGDVHAHFFALSLAALLFCTCYALFDRRPSRVILSIDRRRAVQLLLGIELGAIWLTNTWDLPTYGLLALLCALWTMRPGNGQEESKTPLAVAWAFLPFVLAYVVAWSYTRTYQPQVKGAVIQLWQPGPSFLLFWAGFLVLWVVCLEARTKTKAYRYGSPFVPLLLLFGRNYKDLAFVIAMLVLTFLSALALHSEEGRDQRSDVRFETLMALCGFLALLAPMLFFIKGFFGEGYLHQDTVFKFTLQAWLLLGTAATCGAITVFCNSWPHRPRRRWTLGIAWAVIWLIPLFCAGCIVYTRTVRDAPRHFDGSYDLSLDGARYLPDQDWLTMQWLLRNAKPGDRVLEAVGQGSDGKLGGEYEPQYARVSALTGVPTPLGWAQHAMYWGADWNVDVIPRWETVHRIYNWADDELALNDLHILGVRYVFIGATERRCYPANKLARMQQVLPVQYQRGDSMILGVP